MAGMDHGQMGHGSMGMGSSEMAQQMVMENGKYSDKAFIDAMVPHHQGAIAMAEVALKNAEHEEINELSAEHHLEPAGRDRGAQVHKEEEFGTSNVPMEMSQEQMRGMGMMMDPQELANKEPFDKAFIDAMIPHHQSAIEMAQVASEEEQDPGDKGARREHRERPEAGDRADEAVAKGMVPSRLGSREQTMSTQIILEVLALRHRLRQRDRWTRRQLEAHQGRALRSLREHAYAHSPFYDEFHKGSPTARSTNCQS